MNCDRRLAGRVAALACFGLAACGSETTQSQAAAPAASSVECVTPVIGAYHWDGTAFVEPPAVAGQDLSSTAGPRQSADWVIELEDAFAADGFAWMGLHTNGPVAVLTGLAPDAASKEQGFQAGREALDARKSADSDVTLVIDGISIEDGARGVGEALAELADGEANLRRCQAAFSATMTNRSIMFQSNLAIISPTSERLMDALTGVALLCDAYAIEIGAHTDSRGSNAYNEVISQQRSDAVRDYMVARGVAAEALTTMGYGESRPIDRAETYEAWAKNRRMEFKVSERR